MNVFALIDSPEEPIPLTEASTTHELIVSGLMCKQWGKD